MYPPPCGLLHGAVDVSHTVRTRETRRWYPPLYPAFACGDRWQAGQPGCGGAKLPNEPNTGAGYLSKSFALFEPTGDTVRAFPSGGGENGNRERAQKWRRKWQEEGVKHGRIRLHALEWHADAGTTGESFALATAALAPYMGEGSRAVDWTWSRGGKPVGSVRGVVSREDVLLWYTLTRAGGEPEHIQDVLPLAWTPCTLGGTRPWFACPGCGTRRRMLYLSPAGSRFRCRACHGLAYGSTRMDALERATERVRTVQRRLKPTGEYDPFAVPPRPQGMRARTYERILGELREAQFQRDEVYTHDLAAFVKRLNRFTKQ